MLCTLLQPQPGAILAHTLADVPAVTVRTLHSLMNELVDSASRSSELPDVDENDLLEVFLPELALDILLESPTPGASRQY